MWAASPWDKIAAATPKPPQWEELPDAQRRSWATAGQSPAYMILRELNALKARVAELERHLAVAEQELALREVEGFRTSTTKEAALA